MLSCCCLVVRFAAAAAVFISSAKIQKKREACKKNPKNPQKKFAKNRQNYRARGAEILGK
jgi:hypothetical protein